MIEEIRPDELVAELQSANPPKLLDVREGFELEIAKLPYDVHIPLGQLPDRFSELDREANWVVYCRSGGRSGQAVQFLASQGFERVRNLVGGTLRWSDDVDPSMAKY